MNIPFLQSGSLIPGEASRLILEAFDALPDNAKEEKEHATMLIEWMRQQDKELAKELKKYLFAQRADIANL